MSATGTTGTGNTDLHQKVVPKVNQCIPFMNPAWKRLKSCPMPAATPVNTPRLPGGRISLCPDASSSRLDRTQLTRPGANLERRGYDVDKLWRHETSSLRRDSIGLPLDRGVWTLSHGCDDVRGMRRDCKNTVRKKGYDDGSEISCEYNMFATCAVWTSDVYRRRLRWCRDEVEALMRLVMQRAAARVDFSV